jgi:[ribosomal protein S18]-alanine N-acetyltransferase
MTLQELFDALSVNRLSASWLIREAAAGDAIRLAALHAQALPPGWPAEDFASACGDARRAVLTACKSGEPEGFILLQFAADEAEVLALAVSGDRRRQGCAASLVRAAINLCAIKFVTCIYLEVAESNKAARSLYESFGFIEIARRENYYRTARFTPETALIMKREAGLSASAVDPERSSI